MYATAPIAIPRNVATFNPRRKGDAKPMPTKGNVPKMRIKAVIARTPLLRSFHIFIFPKGMLFPFSVYNFGLTASSEYYSPNSSLRCCSDFCFFLRFSCVMINIIPPAITNTVNTATGDCCISSCTTSFSHVSLPRPALYFNE